MKLFQLGKLVLLENAKFPIKTGQRDIQTFSSLCKKSWSSHSRNVQSQIYAAQKVAWPGRMRTRPTVGILRYRVNFSVWSLLLYFYGHRIYNTHLFCLLRLELFTLLWCAILNLWDFCSAHHQYSHRHHIFVVEFFVTVYTAQCYSRDLHYAHCNTPYCRPLPIKSSYNENLLLFPSNNIPLIKIPF